MHLKFTLLKINFSSKWCKFLFKLDLYLDVHWKIIKKVWNIWRYPQLPLLQNFQIKLIFEPSLTLRVKWPNMFWKSRSIYAVIFYGNHIIFLSMIKEGKKVYWRIALSSAICWRIALSVAMCFVTFNSCTKPSPAPAMKVHSDLTLRVICPYWVHLVK